VVIKLRHGKGPASQGTDGAGDGRMSWNVENVIDGFYPHTHLTKRMIPVAPHTSETRPDNPHNSPLNLGAMLLVAVFPDITATTAAPTAQSNHYHHTGSEGPMSNMVRILAWDRTISEALIGGSKSGTSYLIRCDRRESPPQEVA
jgi:hypothetical protein